MTEMTRAQKAQIYAAMMEAISWLRASILDEPVAPLEGNALIALEAAGKAFGANDA
jgi:hypothetical protein